MPALKLRSCLRCPRRLASEACEWTAPPLVKALKDLGDLGSPSDGRATSCALLASTARICIPMSHDQLRNMLVPMRVEADCGSLRGCDSDCPTLRGGDLLGKCKCGVRDELACVVSSCQFEKSKQICRHPQAPQTQHAWHVEMGKRMSSRMWKGGSSWECG